MTENNTYTNNDSCGNPVDNSVNPTKKPTNKATKKKRRGGNPYLTLKKLNKRHIKFVKEYALTRNGAESARKAGFTGEKVDNTAYLMLQSPLIKEALEKEHKRILEQYNVHEADLFRVYYEILTSKEVAEKDRLHAADSLAKIKQLMGNTNTTTNVNIQSELMQSPLFNEVKTHKIA